MCASSGVHVPAARAEILSSLFQRGLAAAPRETAHATESSMPPELVISNGSCARLSFRLLFPRAGFMDGTSLRMLGKVVVLFARRFERCICRFMRLHIIAFDHYAITEFTIITRFIITITVYVQLSLRRATAV